MTQSALSADHAHQRVAQRYSVESEIARGGMGVVYKVRDLDTGRVFALKRILPGNNEHRSALLAAFEREYQVLASLDHPGIIRVFEYGVDSDQPYYTMELVEGSDMRQLSPLPWREACRRLRDVASALSLLHARRLIHRDLSPTNVKLTPAGRCKLLDFGALTDFGYPKYIVGTPPMIPPEMVAGGMLDQRADLYALGALAYWLMTGRHAFPAARIADLDAAWRLSPPLPSTHDRSIPQALDELVMSLLSATPLARPSSAAQLIAHLNGIAELEPQPEAERQRLARSFLAVPAFVGRSTQLQALSERIATTIERRGHVVSIHGAAGSGRSRLLEEAGVRAQIAGAAVLRIDASKDPRSHGTSRAVIARLFEALPEVALEQGRRFRSALAMLGGDVLARIGDQKADSLPDADKRRGSGELSDLVLAIAQAKPLVLQIDNAEFADDVSLGLLVTLARAAPQQPLLLIVVERSDRLEQPSLGLRTLRGLSSLIGLPPLSSSETLALVRSMFGEAPNVKRFAEWLHNLTAGSPLLTVELARQLVVREEARYEDGQWQLPRSQPETQSSALLDDLLSARIARLSPDALDLALCLGISRVEADFALCASLSGDREEREVHGLLDELTRFDVLHVEQGIYHFNSVALREVLLARTPEPEHALSHLRVGRSLVASAGDDPVQRIEAGWHFIRAGHELEGADLIAAVTKDPWLTRRLSANLYRIAAPVEAALRVYKRNLRPSHMRLPLLCALAQAGFFDDYRYSEQYADEALELAGHFSGMRLARQLRFLGKHLALYIGLAAALIRWLLIPRSERPFRFLQVLVQLFGTVLSSVAVAALRLDAERAERVADVLEPFTAMPLHMTAPSLYRFCHGLQQVGREHQVQAAREFEHLVAHFSNPRSLRLVPADARVIFLCSAHFARGAFAIFRDDGRAALESARLLESSGLRLYAMIGSQLQYLYHVNRGELHEAEPHRARVELHAAHFGSAWQVELWEPAALLPLQFAFDDPAVAANLAHQLEVSSRHVPSLRRYARIGALVAHAVRNDDMRAILVRGEPEVLSVTPRSYIGWSAAVAAIARGYNKLGDHALARQWCNRALQLMTEADREYVALFLPVDLQTAIADAGLGRLDDAFTRVDALIARFEGGMNPFTLGRLHEQRARLAWQARRLDEFQRSLAEVERWLGRSSTPALVAM